MHSTLLSVHESEAPSCAENALYNGKTASPCIIRNILTYIIHIYIYIYIQHLMWLVSSTSSPRAAAAFAKAVLPA